MSSVTEHTVRSRADGNGVARLGPRVSGSCKAYAGGTLTLYGLLDQTGLKDRGPADRVAQSRPFQGPAYGTR